MREKLTRRFILEKDGIIALRKRDLMVFLARIPFMAIGFAYHDFEEVKRVKNAFL